MKAKVHTDLVIAGGGPAGMMAAISASSCGLNVTLLEKNSSCGKKLLLAGGGRCNFTNACDAGELSSHYFHGGKFLRNAFEIFSHTDLIDFFKKRGVVSYTEADGRVFPKSNNAADILRALSDEMKKYKVTVLDRESLECIILKDKTVDAVKTSKRTIHSRKGLILATGGISYPHTGSDGGGLRIATKTGHTVTPLAPGLCGIKLAAPYIKGLQGVSVPGVILAFFTSGKKIKTAPGDIIFTDTGISGPLSLSASSRITHILREKRSVTVSIDFLPQFSKETLSAYLTGQWQMHGRRAIKNTLNLLPQRLVYILLHAYKIDPDKTSAYISKAERKTIQTMLKETTWKVTSLEAVEQAMVTSGGISLKEIDPRSMASRLIRRLYIAGEMLDIDGDTGGFNLQAAFSTGYCAGIRAAQA